MTVHFAGQADRELARTFVKLSREKARERAQWEEVLCSNCGGHGLTHKGVGEVGNCRDCKGNGTFWRHDTGTLALWPGGPLAGSDKAKSMTTVAARTT